MKTSRIVAWAGVLALGLALLLPAAAQDGPIRQRIRERIQERQAQRAPQAGPATTTHPQALRPGDHRFTLRHDGLERMYLVHVPPSYDPARPTPVLFALHGGGGNMDHQANDRNYGLVSKSDKEGFIAVFPNGYSRMDSGKFATWNAGHCCGGARDRNVDDLGFIRKVFEQLTRQVNVDRARVYATGMSNGGLMSYRLACEMSDVFKAIAPVAGTDNTRSCSPARPVAVLHIHAKDDTHVLFNGGAGPDAVEASKVTDFTSVPATVAKWTALNGCFGPPRRVLDRPGAYCDLYAGCSSGAPVQLCVTETGGHSWPGGHKARAPQPPSQAISANDVMWEFFSRR
jgi:polyhydroxybutyrate depolymerase